MSDTRKPDFMKCNCTCPEARELFSPYLDGEISTEESDLLTGHLLLCNDCREEFDLWKKVSECLRTEAVNEEPSAGFSLRVVNSLASQKKTQSLPGRRLFGAWRAPAAAAAAAIMIFTGSWGVSVALKGEKQPPPMVAEQPVNPVVDSAQTGPVKTVEPDSQGSGDKPSVPVEQPANPPKNTGGEVNTGIKDPAATTPVQTGEVALMNASKIIPSTTLKISTNNPANSRDIALGMAADLGGGGQVLDSQKSPGGELTIMRMTVPRNNGSTLVSQLSGLGGIIERSDGKADITTDYNAALNRLADIQATIASGINDREKSRLESEASALKRQIEKWDSEVASYAVVLWLEQ
ncbi:MAG: hypothetical protein JL50_11170 [Peptococcaceae bacterium BICA1-7]|nr:MAG: hypothetical protein JL50_11170 [Peptococcaceae bacterium BICA1-7]